ncbi:thymidine phosphorylase-like [Lingula anatina]|uniref:Thymidine phosphorylase n=1 Tax=Lingula anatina TaxID=7574 RepID=A0A1S3K301_LINAN|nr:thymidine phosphorylase-like [Lingula anatina]|eukprot:XP_013416636.1 thymidine phosphorylase-like [Lingula anatina]
MFSIPGLIRKKRDRKTFSREEIEFFIQELVKEKGGAVQDCQLGAMLMAIFLNGMTLEETSWLTRAMRDSGEVLSWPLEWKGCVVDKHSTGGVGDKVSLPLAPALAACGMKVPMISGRGLGHTGGTLDKLESIPGFQVMIASSDMLEILEKVGCCIVGQTNTLVPSDRIMYATRDVTSTVDSVPLIVGSIVSKKAAEGLDALVLDIKVGKGSYTKNVEEGRKLGGLMVSSCESMGIKTVALLTNMDSPLGKTIGNSLEVQEALDCLRGQGPGDLKELVVNLGAHLLYAAQHVSTVSAGKLKMEDVISSGAALEKFCAMLKAQGVAEEVAEQLCQKQGNTSNILASSHNVTPLNSVGEGWVADIDALKLAEVSGELGAGRKKAGDKINFAVGIQLLVQVGDRIERGKPWVEIHHDEPLGENQLNKVQAALKVENEPVSRLLVLDIVTSQSA